MDTLPRAREIELDGSSLTVADLRALADTDAAIAVSAARLEIVEQAHSRLVAARNAGTVYGANTGVGANRSASVGSASGQSAAHGARLLRSHASGMGALEDERTARAAMGIRLNQILAGGSGVSVGVADALVDALRHKAVPALHRIGSVGTGDLTAMAELALTLIGEREWLRGGIPAIGFADTDAMPFLSSGAVTLATAALAADDLQELAAAATVVTALTFLALRGSSEHYDEAVHRSRPYPEQQRIARRVRELTAVTLALPRAGIRLQDPFGLRAAPQVQGPWDAALARLVATVEAEMNASVENPLVLDDGVRHNGQFHLAALAADVDAARGAAHPVFSLSAARLSLLMRPDITGLPPFLAGGTASSSGLMILEYVAQDALAQLRVATAPVTNASISMSLGLEEHASFATQSARMLEHAARLGPTVLALELVAAVRALRMDPQRVVGTRAEPIFARVADELDAGLEDRPLSDDIERAESLLPTLAALVPSP